MEVGYPTIGNFNPRSPHGERRGARDRKCVCEDFNPRSPHGERHYFVRGDADQREISIHAPRTGSDTRLRRRSQRARIFQSTLPARGATGRLDCFHLLLGISIHAPRTGSDRHGQAPDGRVGNFNPRSPHGERLTALQTGQIVSAFQSTLPARGATGMCDVFGACDGFQSTLPARGATFAGCRCRRVICISIHAPRTGSDASRTRRRCWRMHFNPRSPHGERLFRVALCLFCQQFQSTLPARGATSMPEAFSVIWEISIHAPRTGSDPCVLESAN